MGARAGAAERLSPEEDRLPPPQSSPRGGGEAGRAGAAERLSPEEDRLSPPQSSPRGGGEAGRAGGAERLSSEQDRLPPPQSSPRGGGEAGRAGAAERLSSEQDRLPPPQCFPRWGGEAGRWRVAGSIEVGLHAQHVLAPVVAAGGACVVGAHRTVAVGALHQAGESPAKMCGVRALARLGPFAFRKWRHVLPLPPIPHEVILPGHVITPACSPSGRFQQRPHREPDALGPQLGPPSRVQVGCAIARKRDATPDATIGRAR